MNESVILKHIVVAPDVYRTVDRPVCRGIEEINIVNAVIFVRDVPPAGLELAAYTVVETAAHGEQAVELAEAYAVIIKMVVVVGAGIIVPRKLADPGHGDVVDEVVEIAVKLVPALPVGLVKGKAVVDAAVDLAEMTALFVGVVGIDKGVNAVLLLNVRVARNVVKRARPKVDIVADVSAERCIDAGVFIPNCVSLRGQRKPGHNTDGVGRCGINGLGLIDPVAYYRKRMFLIVEHCARKGKVFV